MARATRGAEGAPRRALPAVRPPLRGPGPAAVRPGPDRGRRSRGGGAGGLRPRRAPPRPRRGRAAAPGLQAPVERRARRGLPAVPPSPDARVPRIRGGVLRGGDGAGGRGRRLLPGLLLRPRPGPRPRRPLWRPPSAQRRRRALLLSLARGRQRVQAAEPLPALDGPEGRGGPRRLDGGVPGDPRHAPRRPHLRDRPPDAADALQVARLADGPRHHAPPAPFRPPGSRQVRLRLPPHGSLQEGRGDPLSLGIDSRPRMRIVSLLPSATEIVCALGFRERLVGRSHECDFPSGVGTLPALTAPKMNPGAGTEAIDRDVRRLVEQGLSVYRIDTAALEGVQPDLVLTQDQCEVCAVSLGDVTAAVSGLARRPVQVVSLSPLSLRAVFESVETVARALGAEERGRELVAQMKSRLASTAAAAPRGPRPRVAHVEWIAPLMVGGHWIHELVEAAGGEHRLGVRDGLNRPVPWDEVRAYDPEVVVIAPCGFKIGQGERDLSLLERLPGWTETGDRKSVV